MFPFHDLPLELQREIFVQAATLNPRSLFELVLVSKRVKSWVLPLIYDVVVLGSTDAPLFLRTMRSMPPEFFSMHVRHLCLSVSVDPQDALAILSACTAVVDLAFWVDPLGTDPTPSFSPLITSLPLRRLSIEITHFVQLFQVSQARPRWSEAITHLDIIFGTDDDAEDTGDGSLTVPHLDQLPHLSHLILRLGDRQISRADLLHLLEACASIEVLVIYDHSDLEQERISSFDTRVVHIPYPAVPIREWESQVYFDEGCTWTRAEALIRKQAAEQKGTSAPTR